MNANSFSAIAAALLSAALALAVVINKRHSVASWCFFAGMLTFAMESAHWGILLRPSFRQIGDWETIDLVIKSFLPGIWLSFSLSYSRGNYREFLSKWKYILATVFLLPIIAALAFRRGMLEMVPPLEFGGNPGLRYSEAGKALNIVFLSSTVLILMNLEQTFRSAVGTKRWRVKFVVLGLAVIFGARIYTVSQAVIFSAPNPAMAAVETSALIVACIFMVIAYVRRGFAEIDVYPSHALLRSSVTVLLVGGYLLLVGVLAQAMVLLGGAENFELRAFIVLLGVAALAVILLSERFRQSVNRFVSVHFRRPHHDFRKVWTELSQGFSNVVDTNGLCIAAVKLVSETFKVLSVTIWLVDEHKQQLVLGASTCQMQPGAGDADTAFSASKSALTALRRFTSPFNLDEIDEPWSDALCRMNATQFLTGGNRVCVPLFGGARWLGLAVLADRVNGAAYTVEELDLLKCLGDQLAATLLNLRLTEEVMLAKQLEAFQTMSTFFVHDLKNAASTLSLMLQNLPVHFNNPDFREDALRGIATTVSRINELIARLSVLRNKLELHPVNSDLNLVVTESLKCLEGVPDVHLVTDLQVLPELIADRDNIQSVVTNLLLNARDAVGKGGSIKVETSTRDGQAILSVTDNGCGMSPAFLRDSLFRPFQTTKKKGLGIGMFQSKVIVGAHRGSIHVESEPGKGTTFRVSLPLR